LVVEGSNVTVCVEAEAFKKIDVPEWLRQRLEYHLETSDPQSTP
jgi:acyl-CoA thioesterase FadM